MIAQNIKIDDCINYKYYNKFYQRTQLRNLDWKNWKLMLVFPR
jgi:hypothetical protein